MLGLAFSVSYPKCWNRNACPPWSVLQRTLSRASYIIVTLTFSNGLFSQGTGFPESGLLSERAGFCLGISSLLLGCKQLQGWTIVLSELLIGRLLTDVLSFAARVTSAQHGKINWVFCTLWVAWVRNYNSWRAGYKVGSTSLSLNIGKLTQRKQMSWPHAARW